MSKDYFEKYKRRLKRSGNDVGDVYRNNTIAFIESTFSASPTFRVLEVDSIEFPEIKQIDARVVEVERLGSLREILFRPNQSLNIGTYVKFDGETWLLFDKYGDSNSIGIKMLATKCNRTLKWKDADGVVREFDCIAGTTDLGSKAKQSKWGVEWNKYDVRLPLGQMFIFVESNEDTRKINIDHRFIFGRNAYKVVGIDDTTTIAKNGFGIIQFVVQVDIIKNGLDDFVEDIAFNSYKKEDEGEEGGSPW